MEFMRGKVYLGDDVVGEEVADEVAAVAGPREDGFGLV